MPGFSDTVMHIMLWYIFVLTYSFYIELLGGTDYLTPEIITSVSQFAQTPFGQSNFILMIAEQQ